MAAVAYVFVWGVGTALRASLLMLAVTYPVSVVYTCFSRALACLASGHVA